MFEIVHSLSSNSCSSFKFKAKFDSKWVLKRKVGEFVSYFLICNYLNYLFQKGEYNSEISFLTWRVVINHLTVDQRDPRSLDQCLGRLLTYKLIDLQGNCPKNLRHIQSSDTQTLCYSSKQRFLPHFHHYINSNISICSAMRYWGAPWPLLMA